MSCPRGRGEEKEENAATACGKQPFRQCRIRFMIPEGLILTKFFHPSSFKAAKDQDLSAPQAFLVCALNGGPWVGNVRGQHEDNLVCCLLGVSFRELAALHSPFTLM